MAVQGCSGSSMVVDFDTNRKRVCDFLLVINSNRDFVAFCYSRCAS